jgi:cystathionine beta-synthase
MFAKTILEAIGNTPLVKLPFPTKATILAKLEYLNPGGSMKDRSALYMIEQAEKKGLLKPGGTIIDASSGNHGIALAMIGAAKGYKVIITVSKKCSKEKYQTLRAYGAQVVVCPSTDFIEHPDSYHSQAQALLKITPNSFMPNQYFNIENANGHYALLGPEIWRQTEGKITHFFAGTGTGGTVSGAGRYLKEQNPAIKVFGIDAATSFHATKGNPQPYKIEGIGIDFDSDVIDYNTITELVNVGDPEALEMLKTLAHEYGFLVGPSSGAVAAGLMQKLPTLQKEDIVVVIFGDSGRAYLSKNFYSQEEKGDLKLSPHIDSHPSHPTF